MNKKYNIIYADPPWNFKAWGKTGRKAPQNHYSCMTDEQIFSLPVQSLCDDNCALFLWATYPLLKEALNTIDSWGFSYRTVAFTWVKTTENNKFHFGLGYWTRANPEICLLATRGIVKRISASVRNLQVHRVREHSRKPDEIRNEIVTLLGDVPRIELFAREKTDGWDVWGNEVESDISLLTT
jgi:N6-adenosine-specific RNA methylase IME4